MVGEALQSRGPGLHERVVRAALGAEVLGGMRTAAHSAANPTGTAAQRFMQLNTAVSIWSHGLGSATSTMKLSQSLSGPPPEPNLPPAPR